MIEIQQISVILYGYQSFSLVIISFVEWFR